MVALMLIRPARASPRTARREWNGPVLLVAYPRGKSCKRPASAACSAAFCVALRRRRLAGLAVSPKLRGSVRDDFRGATLIHQLTPVEWRGLPEARPFWHRHVHPHVAHRGLHAFTNQKPYFGQRRHLTKVRIDRDESHIRLRPPRAYAKVGGSLS